MRRRLRLAALALAWACRTCPGLGPRGFAALTLRPTPRRGHLYWLLCTRGLEPEAEDLVRQVLGQDVSFQRLASSFGGTERISEGHAAVGQLLMSSPKPLPVGVEFPGIIQSYAFVAAASGLSDEKAEGLKELQDFSSGLQEALQTAAQLIVDAEPTFRASVVRDGEHCFSSEEAMQAIGRVVGSIMPWKANMTCYDLEVLAVIHRSNVTFGISCATLGALRLGATKPSRLPREKRPWHLTDARHLRFSTARLMLHFAQLRPGEQMLDLCGGMGTIAMEAAQHWANLRAVSSDVSAKACKLAAENLKVAEREDLFAAGSEVKILRRSVAEWIDFSLADGGCFDVVISELPFGVTIRMLDIRILVEALDKVLRPQGRVAMICPKAQTSDLQDAMFRSSRHWRLNALRHGNVGGVSVDIILASADSW
eukprot:s1549_g10.t1